MPRVGDVERAYRRAYPKVKGKTGRPRTLRSAVNAAWICELIGQGRSVREVSRILGCDDMAILKWVRDDNEKNRGDEIGRQFAIAREIGYELLADSLLAVAERDCTGPDGRIDAGAVQQARLEVDTRKWMLSKMMPKVYGDKVEVSGNPDAPVLTRIELVAVHPKPRLEPPTIDNTE